MPDQGFPAATISSVSTVPVIRTPEGEIGSSLSILNDSV
jgi:hypothetical protein